MSCAHRGRRRQISVKLLPWAKRAKSSGIEFPIVFSRGGVVCLRNGDQRWETLRGAPCRAGTRPGGMLRAGALLITLGDAR